MRKNENAIWDRFAGIYDRFMKKDMDAYQEMLKKIVLRLTPDDKVLEVATGTGLIALGLSSHFRQIDAVDFSQEMIRAAQKKAQESNIENVRFDVQDANALFYTSASYDAVIIANTLHILPETEKVLNEIKRVLKPEGVLIAPTFVHAGSRKAAVLSRLMSLTGFRAYHKWTEESFHDFLGQNGFELLESSLLHASFPLAYVVVRPQS